MSGLSKTGGDDLDDFVFDQEIVDLSAGEEDLQQASLTDEDDFVSEEPDQDAPHESENDAAIAKKRKRRAKEKEKKAKRIKLVATEEELPASMAVKTPAEIADFLALKQAKTFSKLSAIELGDMQIPETSIADTTAWMEGRRLDQLGKFITQMLPTLHTRLSQKSKANGSPTVLFITSAALRVADVTRAFKDDFKARADNAGKDKDGVSKFKGGEVAKLFAKHFKLSEHVAYLKRTKVAAAVGTPARIGKLLCDTDALAVSALTHIMLDVSYLDSKKRSLLDIPETRDEVFKTVFGAEAVADGIKKGKIQVVLF